MKPALHTVQQKRWYRWYRLAVGTILNTLLLVPTCSRYRYHNQYNNTFASRWYRLVVATILNVLLLFSPSARAQEQDTKKEAIKTLEAISKAYSKCQQLSFVIHSVYYNSSGEAEAGSEGWSQVQCQGQDYYCRSGNTEDLHNARYSLHIDHKDKLCIVGRGGQLNLQKDPRRYLSENKKIIEECQRCELSELDSNSRQLNVFYQPGIDLQRLSLCYNTRTMLLEKMILVYANGSRLELNYLELETGKVIDKELFSEKKYFTELEGQKILPAQAYKSYEFINNLFK